MNLEPTLLKLLEAWHDGGLSADEQADLLAAQRAQAILLLLQQRYGIDAANLIAASQSDSAITVPMVLRVTPLANTQ